MKKKIKLDEIKTKLLLDKRRGFSPKNGEALLLLALARGREDLIINDFSSE